MTKEPIRLIEDTSAHESRFRYFHVSCLVLTQDNKIVLQKRGENWDRFPGYLATFGGRIEKGEKPTEAVVRELNEELGAIVEPDDLIYFGAVVEAVTDYTELVHEYFWHDKKGTITGCYEGKARVFDNAAEVMKYPKKMDDLVWLLDRCEKRGLIV